MSFTESRGDRGEETQGTTQEMGESVVLPGSELASAAGILDTGTQEHMMRSAHNAGGAASLDKIYLWPEVNVHGKDCQHKGTTEQVVLLLHTCFLSFKSIFLKEEFSQ